MYIRLLSRNNDSNVMWLINHKNIPSSPPDWYSQCAYIVGSTYFSFKLWANVWNPNYGGNFVINSIYLHFLNLQVSESIYITILSLLLPGAGAFLSFLAGGVYTSPRMAALVLLRPGVSLSSKPISFSRASPSAVARVAILVRFFLCKMLYVAELI